MNSLRNSLLSKKMKYNELKMAHAVSPLENPIQIRFIRRSIARIVTEINNRETK
jgi:large subunit ribosomal protein L29